MKIGELINNSRTLTVKVHGESIEFNYKPGVFTPEYSEKLNEIKEKSKELEKLSDEERVQEAKKSEGRLISNLCDLLTRWDIFEDDGKTMYPISTDSLKKVPYLVLNAIMEAIVEDINPKKTTSSS